MIKRRAFLASGMAAAVAGSGARPSWQWSEVGRMAKIQPAD